MIRTLLIPVSCAVLIQAALLGSWADGSDRQPNIIYVLADDLGYGDLSCYGQKRFETPNLDRMAAEGIRFTDHYSGNTVCAPARCCLMTGMHTGHARVRGNFPDGPFGFGAGLELRAAPLDLTIAEVLKSAGYTTGLVGKWGMGMNGTTGEPSLKGFDQYFGFLNQAHAHWFYPEYLYENGRKIELPENQHGKRGTYVHDLFRDKALEFLVENKEDPFFLYLASTIPHAELIVPEESLAEFRGKFPETPFVEDGQGSNRESRFGAYASQATPNAAYAAMVTRLDRDLGAIMRKLKELGIDEDTVVMFSSDNGPHTEGGCDPEFFDSNGPFRGVKRDLYEGGIRVPMIVRWPAKIAPGQTTDLPSAFWDVLPTCAELAGMKAPVHVDGISFLPTLLGNTEEQEKHEFLYWEFNQASAGQPDEEDDGAGAVRPAVTKQAVRMGRWKAFRESPLAKLELYNLHRDPGETRDVAERHAEVVEKIEGYLETARTGHEVWPLELGVSEPR
jgi:arylsulfatase A-like enzyme